MRDIPALGHGIGLRTEHYADVLATPPPVDWFEVISDNFMVPGGNPRRVLRAVRERWPVVLHGVEAVFCSAERTRSTRGTSTTWRRSPGRSSPPSSRITSAGAATAALAYAHDLLPLPFTEEALTHVATRVRRVQDRLKRRILVENVSSYVAFTQSSMTEWEFLSALAERADLRPPARHQQRLRERAQPRLRRARLHRRREPRPASGSSHLAGHSRLGELLLDTHDHPVRDEVWDLYRHAVARFGAVPTLVEWDDKLPSLERVVEESLRAKVVAAEVERERSVQRPRAAGARVADGPALAELQRRFFELVTAPEGIAKELAVRGIPEAEVAALIAGDARASAVERLDVYANMYFFRILDVLRADYPKVLAVVGDAAFHDLATDYLQAHPSRHPSLRFVGAALPAFLEGHARAAERPWLVALAALEWARVDVFDSADTPVLAREALAAIAPEAFAGLALRPVAACALVPAAWAVEDVWRAVESADEDQLDADAPPAPAARRTRAPRVAARGHGLSPGRGGAGAPRARATGRRHDRRRHDLRARFGALCDASPRRRAPPRPPRSSRRRASASGSPTSSSRASEATIAPMSMPASKTLLISPPSLAALWCRRRCALAARSRPERLDPTAAIDAAASVLRRPTGRRRRSSTGTQAPTSADADRRASPSHHRPADTSADLPVTLGCAAGGARPGLVVGRGLRLLDRPGRRARAAAGAAVGRRRRGARLRLRGRVRSRRRRPSPTTRSPGAAASCASRSAATARSPSLVAAKLDQPRWLPRERRRTATSTGRAGASPATGRS